MLRLGSHESYSLVEGLSGSLLTFTAGLDQAFHTRSVRIAEAEATWIDVPPFYANTNDCRFRPMLPSSKSPIGSGLPYAIWEPTQTSLRHRGFALTALKDLYFHSRGENQSSYAAPVTFPS
jgi:hypothetical protein